MIRFQLTIIFLVVSLWSKAQTLHIDAPVKFLALGDSYTYGQSVPTGDKWPIQLIQALRLRAVQSNDPKVIATSGWRTDDLIDALSEDTSGASDYNLVSLLIGVNNYYQGGSASTYRTEFEQLLKTAILMAKGQKQHVIVLSIPDYGYTPFGQSNQSTISQGIDAFNSINRQITSSYGVPYCDITDISRLGLMQPDLVAGDGLHPAGKQYALWVQRILDKAVINKGDNPVDQPDTLITSNETSIRRTSVYPNPFVDQLIIEGPTNANHGCLFRLTNALGTIVIEQKLLTESDRQSISTQGLPPGVYFYRLFDNSGNHLSGKLVK